MVPLSPVRRMTAEFEETATREALTKLGLT
jgi:hypothetical protein